MQATTNYPWGTPPKGRFTHQPNSHILCIILPGAGYLLDRSYLDYSKKLASSLDMDVYELEYSFHITRAPFDIPSQFDQMAKESIDLMLKEIPKTYDRYIIIGKSIGTCVQILLNESLASFASDIINVYISPIDKTAAMGITPNSLVITGLCDPLLSKESLNKIKEIQGIRLVTVEEGDHSLDIPKDVIKTIEELKINMIFIKEFIS